MTIGAQGHGHTIITEWVYPPIPDRSMDWRATFDDYDGAPDSHSEMGVGPTELAAIADLLQQRREREEEEEQRKIDAEEHHGS